MAYEKVKTEHAGAKNGGGAWTTRAAAKRASTKRRRRADRVAAGWYVGSTREIEH